jgi:hypothetical protein
MAVEAKAPARAGAEAAVVAELYARWILDGVVEVAHAVALDFVARPRHYRRVSDETAAVLEQFKARTGHEPDWPDAGQRAAIFGALFGVAGGAARNGGNSPFAIAGASLREAAVAFAERVYDTGVGMLRQRFRDTMIALRAYLSTLHGQVVLLGERQTQAIFDRARGILSDRHVAATFGLPPAPGGTWPLGGTFSGDGAYLVEEISRTLRSQSLNPVLERHLLVLQRVADYGRSTLARVLDEAPGWDADGRIDALIGEAYSWEAALRDLARA